ncbi:MAG: DUF465 domain-containing protein [Acidobacteriota bacterium]|nr:DUF465 domain-containing protein [Acidobacteriota bacterium]MDH3522992.1 DUF465 domain-containing protein [Acidobacteriota bacterium]
MPDSALTQELRDTDDEYRRLYEEHQDCERRLDELRDKFSLSEADELAVKHIKRHKLFLKDRMEEIARSRQTAGATA